jgi:hypothetical protein
VNLNDTLYSDPINNWTLQSQCCLLDIVYCPALIHQDVYP